MELQQNPQLGELALPPTVAAPPDALAPLLSGSDIPGSGRSVDIGDECVDSKFGAETRPFVTACLGSIFTQGTDIRFQPDEPRCLPNLGAGALVLPKARKHAFESTHALTPTSIRIAEDKEAWGTEVSLGLRPVSATPVAATYRDDHASAFGCPQPQAVTAMTGCTASWDPCGGEEGELAASPPAGDSSPSVLFQAPGVTARTGAMQEVQSVGDPYVRACGVVEARCDRFAPCFGGPASDGSLLFSRSPSATLAIATNPVPSRDASRQSSTTVSSLGVDVDGRQALGRLWPVFRSSSHTVGPSQLEAARAAEPPSGLLLAPRLPGAEAPGKGLFVSSRPSGQLFASTVVGSGEKAPQRWYMPQNSGAAELARGRSAECLGSSSSTCGIGVLGSLPQGATARPTSTCNAHISGSGGFLPSAPTFSRPTTTSSPLGDDGCTLSSASTCACPTTTSSPCGAHSFALLPVTSSSVASLPPPAAAAAGNLSGLRAPSSRRSSGGVYDLQRRGSATRPKTPMLRAKSSSHVCHRLI